MLLPIPNIQNRIELRDNINYNLLGVTVKKGTDNITYIISYFFKLITLFLNREGYIHFEKRWKQTAQRQHPFQV